MAGSPVISLVGPTASGKTALGIALAQRIGGEIINADSMQFYSGMDIGTAKVTADEMQGVPHHLIDIVDVEHEASVAEFQQWSRQCIDEIRGRRKYPILLGGSGLYVRAALDTLEFPPTDPDLRAELTEHVAKHGTQALKEELEKNDPVSAERLADERRIIRAVEVFRLSGRPFSSYMPTREYAEGIEPVVHIGLDLSRETLHQRIEQRVDKMLADGWVEEVRNLDLSQAPTASKAIGYREILQYLEGEISLDYARERTIIATRQFAKRQLTWFKADPRIQWLDPTEPDLLSDALRLIQETR